MPSRLLTLLLLTLTLAACVEPTAYKAAWPGDRYGFSEQVIAPNRFRVAFRSNTVTPRETAENYALLRAAEITLAQGGDWFVVTERDISYDGAGWDDEPRGGVGIGGGSRGIGAGVGISVPLGMEGPESRTVSLVIDIRRGAKPAGEKNAYDARAVRQALAPQG